MQRDDRLPRGAQDRALWRRSRDMEATEDEAERYLDLAGFADGRLDAEEEARIGEVLARDPAAASDIDAARRLAPEPLPATPETVSARAAALVEADASPKGRIVSFPLWRRAAPDLPRLAQWGSLAAAVVMAAWLGFALGADTSISFTRAGQGDNGVLNELLNPSTGFLRDLTEGTQT
jgi:anti-sigma factor RsiW